VSRQFKLKSPYQPAGDQAIKQLTAGLKKGLDKQTLLGVTGSGKTFTMASVIQNIQKPALVISHNKTLAAQLTEEFREFFPDNAVEYFVSYYDYYQPEAYIARTDTYIAKDASINDEVDRLRHSALASVLTRPDVIIVASVSCIYGLGNPQEYFDQKLLVKIGDSYPRPDLLKKLTSLHYARNDMNLRRGTFRVRGDIIDIYPASEERLIRIESFGPAIESLTYLDPLTGEVLDRPRQALIFPATFFITDQAKNQLVISSIRRELKTRLAKFKKRHKLLEAQRLEQRVNYDLAMIQELGYVSGIENYSRYFDGRSKDEPPFTLLDYFHHHYGPDGFLTIIDESHMTVPQIGAMSGGDSARKDNLIRYGWRLPSARDNRPLKFPEFEDRIGSTIFVSATPGDYEQNTSRRTVEQIIRPTGLLDPTIDIKPLTHQIDSVMDAIKDRIAKQQRVLVTTLTKRMAEELSSYLIETGTKAAYIHADVATLDRLTILRDLRAGKYDVLVGINLLREGLDLPEVSLVAIMDADKEGYLRSTRALIQNMGRAARHLDGHVIMYADIITGSMRAAIDETNRRRAIQAKHNQQHHITPQTITKAIRDTRLSGHTHKTHQPLSIDDIPDSEKDHAIKTLTQKMDISAKNLDFESAAEYRDLIQQLKKP